MSDSRELVLVTEGGTEVAPLTGTELVEAGPSEAEEAPPQIPKARERDPERMTPEECRRLVNRLRKARFILWFNVAVFETPFKGDFRGWQAHEYMQVTAPQLMDLMKALEKRHGQHYVQVHQMPSDGSRYSLHYVSVS